jgi:tetratricopeptide (TPR) repeat protein
MFTVLLYTRVLITILLVWVILYYIVNRFRQLFSKKDIISSDSNLPLSTEEIEQTMNEDISELIHDDDKIENVVSHEEDLAESIEDLSETTLPLQVADIEINSDLDETTNLTSSENNVIGKDEDVIIESPLSESVTITEDAPKKDVVETPNKQYDYLFVTDPTSPEIPKDLDAIRNIWQWHSRDDIVRDKFEKHIQKIRYEVGILKQRNDILWYEKKLVEWITLLPNDIDFQKQLADLYFQQWKYKKAQSLLKKILVDNSDDHYALWQVGEIATVEGNNEDAYLYLQQAYATCEDNPKYCFSLAQWYYDHDALDQALPLMEKMVKLRPKNIDYLVSLSHVQHKMGMLDQAKQSLLRALELDPMNVTLKNYLKWM